MITCLLGKCKFSFAKNCNRINVMHYNIVTFPVTMFKLENKTLIQFILYAFQSFLNK
uniref:Uncharacterized protein n=1 Tax=Rhizophora mucronata TaxID=61149 RepID=A0A2P2IUU8_RHIMU